MLSLYIPYLTLLYPVKPRYKSNTHWQILDILTYMSKTYKILAEKYQLIVEDEEIRSKMSRVMFMVILKV